jgi:uncharacterized membrane protein YdbT with pleckstrin-like domain
MSEVIERIEASAFASRQVFPPVLTLTETAVLRKDRGAFTESEETIPLERIASVSMRRGLVFATLWIETTGGRVIATQGLQAQDARMFKALLQGVLDERHRDDEDDDE